MQLLFLIGVVVWHATSSNAVIPPNSVISSVNTFSNIFVKAIVEDAPMNLICSPISADMVLSMATFGARENTAKVLRSVLALTTNDVVTKNGLQSLVDSLTDAKGFELRMANKIFLAKGLEPIAEFLNVTATVFRSPMQKVNFANASEATKVINDWAEFQTNNHIKDLVNADDLTSDTALVLVNAIYFNATWENQFFDMLTKSLPFHINGKDVKEVPTMRVINNYKQGALPHIKAQFIEIPYKTDDANEAVSMFIILPDAIDGIGELIMNLDKVDLARLQQGTTKRTLLQLPKFKMESTIDLEKPLSKLGLSEIFSDKADFSGIVSSPPLKVNKIVQKAFIEVNERGTEASAATELQSANRIATRHYNFKVDRPFLAMIATNSGVTLFSSIVTEPIY